MNQIKNLAIVIVVILSILILVFVRSSNRDMFKKDVTNAIEASLNNRNSISPDGLKNNTKPWMIVNLGGGGLPGNLHFEKSIRLPFENLLDQTNRKILKETKGDLILYSADAATSAKAWIILNQLGFQNIYILSSEENPDVLKYEFQPDITARLEQASE